MGSNHDRVHYQELASALGDSAELLDWATNNMDWDDVSKDAVLVATDEQERDYQKWWPNADMEVFEKVDG